MKKVFALLLATVCSMSLFATEYNGLLTVTVNDLVAKQLTSITINPASEKSYDLVLKNFFLQLGGETVAVGNIQLDGVEVANDTLGFRDFHVDQSIQITEGDDPSVAIWYGPMLGEVPIVLDTQFSDKVINFNIDIDMTESIGQIIKVQFLGSADSQEQPGVRGDLDGNNLVDVNDMNDLIDIILGL